MFFMFSFRQPLIINRIVAAKVAIRTSASLAAHRHKESRFKTSTTLIKALEGRKRRKQIICIYIISEERVPAMRRAR